jgi:hypothetical protein
MHLLQRQVLVALVAMALRPLASSDHASSLPPRDSADTDDPRRLFVSPMGDDEATGLSRAYAFRTLSRARDAIRELKAASPGGVVPPGGVVVELAAGSYTGSTIGAVPLALSLDDSGSAEAPVVWRATQPGSVLISAGLMIPATAFTPRPGHSGQLQANLTALGLHDLGAVAGETANKTRAELFYQGEAMRLARWPNAGADGRPVWAYMREPYPFNCSLTAKPCCGLPGPLPCVNCNASTPVGCTGFAFSSVDVPGVETPNNLTAWGAEAMNNHPHLHGYFVEDFSDRYLNISSVYAKNATDASLTVGAAPTPQKVGARFYALNLLSELDEPGEYYIERSTRTPEAAARFGMLYFYPPVGFAESKQPAFVSAATNVISLAPNTSHITFGGLRIEHSRSTAVVPAITPSDPAWWPANPLAMATSGWIQNITFTKCVIANTGQGGLVLERCNGCTVDDSEVYGVGGTGITVSGGNHKTLARSDNLIKNCSIHRYARWSRAYKPGLQWAGVGNSFIGNRVFDAPSQAVVGGGNEAVCGTCHRDHKDNLQCSNSFEVSDDQAACGGNDNLWSGNYFANISWEVSDAGGFYSCGQSGTGFTTRGNVVRDNVFENVRSHVSHPNQGSFGNMNVNAF